MPARRQLIVVSNRGPVSFGRDANGNRVAGRGAGGLVTALRGLVRRHDVTWVASAMSDEDRLVAAEAGAEGRVESLRDGSRFKLRLVPHDPEAYDRFYNVVANPGLWFLQHYLWGLAEAPNIDRRFYRAWDDGYVVVNENFAGAVLRELARQPNAAVCFHDYHLYLAPGMVRERMPNVLATHFVHTPWPETDYWYVLPAALRRGVHAGLLANDIVSLHTRRWCQNFLRSCEDIVGAEFDPSRNGLRVDGRIVKIHARPISVDPGEFGELAQSRPVLDEEERLVAHRPEFLVLRVDRTDPSKNIIRGFQAFELFLEQHPDLHGRVTMLALLDPSRQDIPAYAEYARAIEREVVRINTRFGSERWTAIELVVEDNFAEAVAAYKQFDALLVNAVFDGMNLVAKEAPLVNERDGVVILSENAGASEELRPWTITVNPFDVAGQAEALHEGLTMSRDERGRRLEAIRTHVRRHDISAWIDTQISDLDEVEHHAPTTLPSRL